MSKSFARTNANGDPTAGVDTINISVASYRVVESKKHGKYAQFLVIYREGSIRDTVGLWKRYSDFEELAHRVTHSHESCAAAFEKALLMPFAKPFIATMANKLIKTTSKPYSTRS